MSTPYKMKGSSALGYGNQHSSTKGMPFASPAKDTKKDPDYDKDHQKEYEHIDYGKGDVRHKAKSPAKDGTSHEHTNKENTKHPVTTTRGEKSITKSGDGKSSTYNETKRTKNKDGSTTIVYTNPQGNTETRNQSDI